MTRAAAPAGLVLLACVLHSSFAAAQASQSNTLVLNASVAPHTSLQVSTSILRFDVADDGGLGDAVVHYRLAARTRHGGAVRLTVEPDGTSAGSEAAAVAAVCSAETGAATLAAGRPQSVAEWRGSGVREGTIRCHLAGAAAPGRHLLPVKFAVVLD